MKRNLTEAKERTRARAKGTRENGLFFHLTIRRRGFGCHFFVKHFNLFVKPFQSHLSSILTHKTVINFSYAALCVRACVCVHGEWKIVVGVKIRIRIWFTLTQNIWTLALYVCRLWKHVLCVYKMLLICKLNNKKMFCVLYIILFDSFVSRAAKLGE